MSDPFQATPFEMEPVSERPYDPERKREGIRGTLTQAAMLGFACVVGVYLWEAIHIADPSRWAQVKEAMQVVLPAITSVLGSALGFYFGSQRR